MMMKRDLADKADKNDSTFFLQPWTGSYVLTSLAVAQTCNIQAEVENNSRRLVLSHTVH